VKRGVRRTQQNPGTTGDDDGIADVRSERPAKAVVTKDGRTSARYEEVTPIVEKEPGNPQLGEPEPWTL
jgi:hypothetical protein